MMGEGGQMERREKGGERERERERKTDRQTDRRDKKWGDVGGVTLKT